MVLQQTMVTVATIRSNGEILFNHKDFVCSTSINLSQRKMFPPLPLTLQCIHHRTANITMRTLNKEQMKITDTPELLTPPLTRTATCTAHTHASCSICNITLDFSVSI